MVSDACSRHRLAGADLHLWSAPMASSQLLRLGQIRVFRPEDALVQAARQLDEVDLSLVASELCGTFVIADWDDGRSISVGRPLCTTDELTAAAERYHALGVRGARKVLSALDHVLDNANSAAESRISLMLCLPRTEGGFGLSDISLNQKIALQGDAARAFGRGVIRPDFLHVPSGTAIEYDSRQEHLDPISQDRDSRRRLALGMAGINVHTLTAGQVRNLEQLDLFVEEVSHRAGVRKRPMSVRMLQRHAILHERLLVDCTDPLESL